MRVKLIVATNGATASQRNLISNAVKAAGAGWWHWFQELWLIVDPLGRRPDWWMNYLRANAGQFEGLVVSVDGPSGWAAATGPRVLDGQRHEPAEVFEWLERVQWKKP